MKKSFLALFLVLSLCLATNLQAFASDDIQMTDALDVIGNDNVPNEPLIWPLTTQAYTVKYDIFRDGVQCSGDDGWIGVWLY